VYILIPAALLSTGIGWFAFHVATLLAHHLP
jgi:hypothetical protein